MPRAIPFRFAPLRVVLPLGAVAPDQTEAVPSGIPGDVRTDRFAGRAGHLQCPVVNAAAQLPLRSHEQIDLAVAVALVEPYRLRRRDRAHSDGHASLVLPIAYRNKSAAVDHRESRIFRERRIRRRTFA